MNGCPLPFFTGGNQVSFKHFIKRFSLIFADELFHSLTQEIVFGNMETFSNSKSECVHVFLYVCRVNMALCLSVSQSFLGSPVISRSLIPPSLSLLPTVDVYLQMLPVTEVKPE